MPSLSWSALVLGSIATEITGSGNVIDSSRIGWLSSASVSPVVVYFRPTAAAMSPGEHLVDVLAADGVHPQDAADPLLAPVGRVEHAGSGLEPA